MVEFEPELVVALGEIFIEDARHALERENVLLDAAPLLFAEIHVRLPEYAGSELIERSAMTVFAALRYQPVAAAVVRWRQLGRCAHEARSSVQGAYRLYLIEHPVGRRAIC